MLSNNKMYETSFENEFAKMFSNLGKVIDEIDYLDDLTNTKTLSRCFLVSISSLLKSIYTVLRVNRHNASEILLRSVFEYSIDLQLIIQKNNIEFNTKFVNYPKLFLYWQKDSLEFQTKEIPWIVQEYTKYINSPIFKPEQQFAEEMAGDNQMEYCKVLDKRIRQLYKISWTGLDFTSRIKKIDKDETTDYYFKKIISFFSSLSNSVHPTPYNVIPHFSPKTGNYKFTYDYSSELLRRDEEMLFLICDLTIRAFINTHEGVEKQKLYDCYKENLDNSKNIYSWIMGVYKSKDRIN